MANRKNIWDALDKMEGKKEGSSFKALNKERVRQGYKKEVAKKMGISTRGAANDKRYNAEKHVVGQKPGPHSEYFGTSYAQKMRELKKNK